jgi:hypothetical protein
VEGKAVFGRHDIVKHRVHRAWEVVETPCNNLTDLCSTACSRPSFLLLSGSRGSSVSIVSDYELDDWAIEVRSPAEAKNFSSNLCVQTGSGAHPVSCTMGIGFPFPGAKARPGRDADHSPPSRAEVEN